MVCRGAHVRLDVRVVISLAAQKALVDAVVVHQESRVAVAFVRMPGSRKHHASPALILSFNTLLTLFLQKMLTFLRVAAPWPSVTGA